MAAKSQYLNDKVLGTVLQNTSYTGPATVYVALNTTTSTPTVPGTEVTGGNYARIPVTFTPNPPTASTVSNSGTVAFFGAGATAGPNTIVEAAIYDALTGGNELYFGSLAVSKTVNIGDTLSFAGSALSVTEA
jgi:hypothetical protein